MVAIVTFAVLVAIWLAVMVYSVVHKPQPGEYRFEGTWSPTAPPHIGVTPGASFARRPARQTARQLDARGPVDLLPRPFATFAPIPRVDPVPVTPPPPKLHRDVLSPDPTEHELLVQLRTRPADAETRMVYADMLESRGEPAKANFVRGADRFEDVIAVLKSSDLEWRTLVSRERTRCAEGRCPRTWDAFEPSIDDERQRRCGTCRNVVRYCANPDEEQACAARGERGVLDVGGALPLKDG